MTRKFETSPAEKLQTDRWRVVAHVLQLLLELSDPDCGKLRVTPDSDSDEEERRIRVLLAPMIATIGIAPLQAVMRATSRQPELLDKYLGHDCTLAYDYIDRMDGLLESEVLSDTVEVTLGECQYFARCTRTGDGVVIHPVLGEVVTCLPCANLTRQELKIPDWVK